MARAITAPELALLASPGQHSKVYLAVKPMTVVYSARVNQTVNSTDEMTSITYDGGTGTLADVLPGMLLLVGTSAGAADKGFARIRIVPSATVIYFGMTSEIAFADDDYLTVINDFPLTDKPCFSWDDDQYRDSTVIYSDQHKYMDPIPIMGPMVAVAELVGASVSLTLDPGASTVLGSTISAYAWSATGPEAVTITDDTTATPTMEFTAAGWYRLGLTVTAANTKSSTRYSWVLIWNKTNAPALLSQQAAVDNPVGDADTGIYEFSATLWDHADLANVAERALVVLFSEDWYGETKQSIGPIPGFENVISWGWIAGESINWNPRGGSVKFTVRGPAWWLQQIDAQAVTLKNVDGSDPTIWDQIQDLTVDKALWHVAHWRSTITAVCDLILPGDTTPALVLDGGLGSVWDLLKNIAKKIGAAPICDRYGRIFIQKDIQLTPVASRSTIPVVMDVGKASWKDAIQLERKLVKPTSMVELNALSSGGTVASQLWSRAPGNLSGSYGRSEPVDGYIVADQAGANELAGLILAQRNNPQPVVPLSLAGNNRMIDIAPLQYLTQSIASGDTKRGITWTTRKVIPRRIQLVINQKTGAIHPEIEAEAETGGGAGDTVGITYIPPAIVTPNFPTPPSLPDFPLVPPGTIDFPDIVPVEPPVILECAADWYAPQNSYPIAFSRNTLQAGESITAALACTLRDEDTYNGPSYLLVHAAFDGDSLTEAVVTATNGGSDVATGVNIAGSLGQFMFNLPGPVAVTGFKISMPAGGVVDAFVYGDIISSNSVAATTQAGISFPITLTIGDYYSLEPAGGPWCDYLGGPARYGFSASFDDFTNLISGLYYEPTVAPYGSRFYFQATGTTLKFRVSPPDANFANNTGGISAILRTASKISVRRISNLSASIHNVCA